MTRLPKPGGDDGQWGNLLNDFLSVEHTDTGALKSVARPADVAAKYTLPATGIPESDLSSAVQTKLDNGGTIADGSIAPTKLTTGAQASLTKADNAIPTSQKGAASGVATLDTSSTLTASQLPASVFTKGEIALTIPGDLSVGAGVARYPINSNRTLKGVTVSLGTVANADVIIDVNRNGSSIFADANNRPKILAGQFSATRSEVSVAAAAGDYLTVDRDQVGGPAAITLVGTAIQSGAEGQSVTFARPTGSQSADIHLVALETTVGGAVGSTTEPATVISAPGGWTEIGTAQRGVHKSSDRDVEMHLFWLRDTGTDTGPWVFTATTPTTNSHLRGSLVTYRYCLTGTAPINTSMMTAPAISSTTWTAPSVTPTSSNCLLVCFWRASSDWTSTVAPAGMTLRVGATTAITVVAVADQLLTSTSPTGTKTLTGSLAFSASSLAASVILSPDPSSAAPGAYLTTIIDYENA